MAGQRLTDKTALTEQAGSGDLLMVVDVSDTTGSAEGTSKKTDFKYVIQTDKLSLNNTEVQALDSTPKTLVGALSGYMVTIYNVTTLCTYAASTESANKYLYFGYDSLDSATTWMSARGMMNGLTTDPTFCFSATPSSTGICASSILNKPFVMWSSGAFNGGWSMDVYVTYAYTKVL
tara:strand:- start:285 stop:815 length:531 start_codon:yes stop_codon:yes gene_type:complete